jgi:NAD(P)-dependent dehydrogenase (short-subunit alcohol dehydrogenase family)
MDLSKSSVIVTGGASGLGLATAQRLAERAASVTIIDLPSSKGQEIADASGGRIRFAPADVTESEQLAAAVESATLEFPLRATVHCAGRGATVQVLQRDGSPSNDMDQFESVVKLNLTGTFNVMRYAASAMAKNELSDGDRGVIVNTASVAAFEGQIGQLPYASSKAGVVALTLVGARDLARWQIRVCAIAPGVFDTPILSRFPGDVIAGLFAPVPHPKRLGNPSEYAMLAEQIIDNSMLNGETIRLDGAVRMQPK